MAIIVTQTPNTTFDMAYGANPLTLSNISASADKYVLQIYIVGQADPIADIRQTPNRVGRAIFDLQNIIQSYVGPQVNTIDSLHYSQGFVPQTSRMALAGPTLIEYQIAYAEESGGVVGNITTYPTIFTAIAGSKQYYEVPFNQDPYQVTAGNDDQNPPCTVIESYASPLSDNSYTIPDDLPGKTIGYYSSPGGIDVHNVYVDDQCTKTFYQVVNRNGAVPPDPEVRGIEAFYILQFSATDNLIQTNVIVNIQANGGGPNLTLGQGTLISGQFQTITVASGPANLMVPLNAATKSYYIVPAVYGCPEDPQSQIDVMTEAAWRAQKYIINEPECLDYPHVQFAWQNSLGYRDQFTFTKKLVHNTKTQNNNFLKGVADYNSTSYTADIEDRGFTTFSQKINNDFSVTSGYMNDEEAKLLKHLYQSAEVKVRFSTGEYANQWVPVTILSTSYTEKNYKKDKLFQYTVKFRLASNIKALRG
ncbi:MAG: hypothetical protein K0U52_11485 [Gammaproteobacteria bacterium]|nr:hypothetical protein [Gammaproteobacteria bacterium]